MGKIKQGILGGFNGTTGSVVGASWKGIPYMRGKAQSIKNPRTTSQQTNRSLFGTISDIMAKANSACKKGFATLAVKKSAFNVAVQKNMDFAISHGGSFDLTNVMYSEGGLSGISTLGVEQETGGLKASFEPIVPPTKALKGVGVAIFEGTFPGAPLVMVAEVNVPISAAEVDIDFVVPNSLTYTSCKISAFMYDEETGEASQTTYIGQHNPA